MNEEREIRTLGRLCVGKEMNEPKAFEDEKVKSSRE